MIIKRQKDKASVIIQDVWLVPEKGIIATGKVELGSIKVGDEVNLVDLENNTRDSRVLKIYGKRMIPLEMAGIGEKVAFSLEGINKREDLERGIKMSVK